MWNIKEINIKNRAYYFFNDMVNIKSFDWNLLKTDKKLCKNVDDYESINSVNPLYPVIGKLNEYIEKKNVKKYLIFASADKKRRFDKIHGTFG